MHNGHISMEKIFAVLHFFNPDKSDKIRMAYRVSQTCHYCTINDKVSLVFYRKPKLYYLRNNFAI